jgi:hypothetical protein
LIVVDVSRIFTGEIGVLTAGVAGKPNTIRAFMPEVSVSESSLVTLWAGKLTFVVLKPIHFKNPIECLMP